jgi:hypothetical protein
MVSRRGKKKYNAFEMHKKRYNRIFSRRRKKRTFEYLRKHHNCYRNYFNELFFTDK